MKKATVVTIVVVAVLLLVVSFVPGCATKPAPAPAPATAPKPPPAAELPQVHWRLNTTLASRTSTWAFERLADLVRERTGGKFNMEIFWGSSLVPAAQAIDALKAGTIDGMMWTVQYAPARTPLSSVLQMPFLPMGSAEALSDVIIGEYITDAFFALPEIKAEWESAGNAVWIISGASHAESIWGKGKQPTRVEDFNGKKIRTSGPPAKVFQKIGATTLGMPADEVFSALQTGLLDGVNFFFFAGDAVGIGPVVDWFMSDLSVSYALHVNWFVNKNAWEALPETYRQIVLQAVPEAREYSHTLINAAYDKEVQYCKENNVALISFPAKEGERFASIAQDIWKEWVAEQEAAGRPGQKILDFLLTKAPEAKQKYGFK